MDGPDEKGSDGFVKEPRPADVTYEHTASYDKRPNFEELKRIEAKRRRILLRVSAILWSALHMHH